ncbi:coniferyl aldehyde dehydrogenase [Acinetobacter sp. ANC 5378]|uniref:coniferyl aldehyde dehydrogenase n=1 Tax=Acinetobacter sp. ANC 5378 TaxID=2731249 RepID=UPI00202DE908|nr:coniferyl aldehyde dehydrogenase [Acinetobacter sp. ANC 5378]
MLNHKMDQNTDQNISIELQQLFEKQQQAFTENSYPSLEQRRQHLKTLQQLILQNKTEINLAISHDFSNRSHSETEMFEVMTSVLGIKYALKNLKKWMRPSKRHIGILFQPATGYVLYQPVGVVGIVVPWNYPLFLAIGPLCQALAAGNRVILKMSEYTPEFSALFKQLIAQAFPEDLVSVVNGDAEVAQKFTQLPFNHILFTGASEVGKHVMRAAANNLTPVTLELGGKSPALVLADANIRESARRIAFGKAMNAGQTCVAPDYVLIPAQLQAQFIEEYATAIQEFFPKLADNPDYTAIINERQLNRLNHYLEDATAKNATVHVITDASSGRRLAHYVLSNVTDDMQVMQNEIFGPLLPIVTYQQLDEAINYINQRPRPLALYYFGYNKQEQQKVLMQTHSGGVCLNETLVHVGQEDLPFGGVGTSGLGNYHGYEGFVTFSHAKAVFNRPKFSLMRLFYPPYGTFIQKLILKLFIR